MARSARPTFRFDILPLEDRTTPATLNMQYNVELQTRGVVELGIDTGYDHLSLLVTPQDPSKYHDEDGNGFADEDPMFYHRSDGSYALSISAGAIGGKLRSTFNLANDITRIYPASERATLTKPAAYADSRAWVNALINRSAGYLDTKYDYPTFGGYLGGYNSNSFMAGLLNATGTVISSPATLFPGRSHLAYTNPVPTADYGTGAARRIDLVFAIDTTGSMGDDIASVKSAASQIITRVFDTFRVDGNIDARIAVMDYRDFPTDPYGSEGDYPFHDIQKFTSDPAKANAGIQALALGDGGDWPESVLSGVMHGIQSPSLGSWRGDGVTKAIIVMGDAPGHNPEPFTGYTVASTIQAALDEDPVVLFPVAIGGDTSAVAQFDALAKGTGGTMLRTPNASTVVSALLDAIGIISKTPVAEAGGPVYTGTVGSPVAFSAAGSFDSDGTIVKYEWDWNADGTYDTTTDAPGVSHTFAAPYTGKVWLRVTDADGLVALDFADVTVTPPPALSVTSVTVNDGTAQRSNVESLTVKFNRDANAADLIAGGTIASAVRVRDASGALVPLTTDRYRYDAATFTLTIDLTTDGFGGSRATRLADGRFTLELDTALVRARGTTVGLADDDGTADGVRKTAFHRLFGDFNGDGQVSVADRAPLLAAFGKTRGQAGYQYAFDFNDDGVVNASDYLLWTRRIGRKV